MQQGKLLYVSRLNSTNDKHLGTLKKVRGMCKGFACAFENVYLEYEKDSRFIIEAIDNNTVFDYNYTGLIGRKCFYSDLLKWIEKNGITVFYIRFDHLDNVMVSVFKKLKNEGIEIILEHPTYPYAGERDKRHEKLKSKKKYLEYIVKRIAVANENYNIKSANRYIDKIVTYTYDGKIWNVPSLCIENGVDCDSIKVRDHYSDSNTIVLGCVANLAIWHAVDRVVEGLKRYYDMNSNPKYIVEFWIVGNGQESDHIKNLVKKYGLEDYVLFKGAKRGAELDLIMEQFDIGVGTLGLHRIGLNWGSTLKSKEYCASGLPFIYASKEKGLKGNEPFALKFPDDESMIVIDDVVDFALKVRNDEQLRIQMRKKAEEEYSWTALTNKILRDESYE